VIPKRIGRPVTVAGECSVTIRIPEALLATIDDRAAANKASRSEVMRQLLEQALDAAQKAGIRRLERKLG